MKHLYLLTMLLLGAGSVYSQGKFIPEEAYADARQYILSDEFSEAFPLLKQLADKGYSNSNISYLTGICCLHLKGKKGLAPACFEKAVLHISSTYVEDNLKETNAPPIALYYLGLAYRINARIEDAEKTFKRVGEELGLGENSQNLVNRELEYCRVARELLHIPSTIKLSNPGNPVNTPDDEFNPAISPAENELVYMSSKKFYDAINVSFNDLAGWSIPEELTTEIGSDGEYSVVSISADGKTLFFYTYDMYAGGEIYSSQFNGQRWEKRKKLAAPINTGYSESSASLSPDGKTLYFTSNRPGGKGGYDIYRSTLEPTGLWGTPVNLGDDVNSSEDEATPFVSPDGKYLWFSSKGHMSMGGYDIFRCTILPDGFSWAVNAGSPLNTTDDDLFFVPVQKDNTGYMALADPAGNGNRDIKRIEILSMPDPVRFSISGSAFTNDGIPAEQAGVRLCLDGPDTDRCLDPDSSGLHFNFRLKSGEYKLLATAEGYEPVTMDYKLSIDTRQSEWNEDLILKKIILKQEPILSTDTFTTRNQSSKERYFLGAIYFPFESVEPASESNQRLDSLVTLLIKYPAIAVVLTGYTDKQGTSDYNILLSVNRAKMVAQYLTLKGIEKQRIIYKGKGEENQITIDLNPQTRKWNRRVEIELLKADNLELFYLPIPAPEEYLIP
jgi:outer membrane protein OmpA-like peptidoglycan-associated protein